jgi:hypothetical protein
VKASDDATPDEDAGPPFDVIRAMGTSPYLLTCDTFDARNNTPRIGRVLIARGRDAADVAISTTFGPNTLQSFRVWTDEVAVA